MLYSDATHAGTESESDDRAHGREGRRDPHGRKSS